MLGLKDGTLVLEASSLSNFLACPRLYRYANEEGLRPKWTDTRLLLGTVVHSALAAYYSAWGKEDAESAALQTYQQVSEQMVHDAAARAGGDGEKIRSLRKTQALGERMVRGYLLSSREADRALIREVRHVETPFLVPVLDPDTGGGLTLDGHEVWQAGIFDLVLVDQRDLLWVMDHKTTRQFPSSDEVYLNLQFRSYVLAARYLWPELGDRVAGVIYNGVKSVDPTDPRTKNATWWRMPVRYSEEDLARFARRLVAWARRIGSGDREPSPGPHCGWKCGYRDLCVAEEKGDAIDLLRDSMYTVEANTVGYLAMEG